MKKNILRRLKQLIYLLGRRLYFSLSVVIGLLILLKSFDYLSPDFSKGFLLKKESIFPIYSIFLYSHIISSPVAFLSGLFQLRFPHSEYHSFLGLIYVFSILVLAAPSGLVMSFYAPEGIITCISFAIMSALWFVFTLMSYVSIKKKNIIFHKRFAYRSFILTNSAILLRIFLFVNNQFIRMDPSISYPLIAWLSWFPCWLIYELRLLKRKQVVH